MKAIDLIRWALRLSDDGMAQLVEGVRNTPLTFSTPGAKGGDGNHPLWCLGHQAYLEAGIPKILFGEENNPLERWAPMFAPGTRPVADAGAYPPFDEVLSTCRGVRQRTVALLETIGEQGLDRKPKAIPPGFEGLMPTFGQTFLALVLHQMVHYGQVADARRVAGVAPLF